MNPRSLAPATTDTDPEETRGQRPISESVAKSAVMAATIQAPSLMPSMSSQFANERPRLPPLSQLSPIKSPTITSPLTTPTSSGPHPQPPLLSATALFSTIPPTNKPPLGSVDKLGPAWQTYPTPVRRIDHFHEIARRHPEPIEPPHGVKRSWADMARPSDRLPPTLSALPPLVTSDYRSSSQSRQHPISYPHSAASTFSEPGTPSGIPSSTPAIYPMSGSSAQSVTSSASNTYRCSLHIRQQPRAARAGPDGKDRRPIDPPPVLQLLMMDFDPSSERDINELRSNRWVVHTRLMSASSPRTDVSSTSAQGEDGTRGEVTRHLLGTTVSSPFFCSDDPDPDSIPQHPISESGPPSPRPPSPTDKFIPTPSQRAAANQTQEPQSHRSSPSTFFIFADLSVRKSGEYRLEFRLMKIEPSNLQTGSRIPVVHCVISDTFRVFNAKDFDQVKPSTALVKGLLDRGAGFPLKYKKGLRESTRPRRGHGSPDEASGEGAGDEQEEEHQERSDEDNEDVDDDEGTM